MIVIIILDFDSKYVFISFSVELKLFDFIEFWTRTSEFYFCPYFKTSYFNNKSEEHFYYVRIILIDTKTFNLSFYKKFKSWWSLNDSKANLRLLL